MTIEDFIRKFFFNLQMEHRESFTGKELCSYVCTVMSKHTIKSVKPESVLRCLRKLKNELNIVDYDSSDPMNSIYKIYPKRGK